MDYFWGFVSALFAIFVLNIYASYRSYRFQREITDTAREAANLFVAIRWEKDKDTVYAYNRLDDQFVAQGRTFEEWRANFQARFPEKKAIIELDFLDSFGEAAVDQES